MADRYLSPDDLVNLLGEQSSRVVAFVALTGSHDPSSRPIEVHNPSYRTALEAALDHPDKNIRYWSAALLGSLDQQPETDHLAPICYPPAF